MPAPGAEHWPDVEPEPERPFGLARVFTPEQAAGVLREIGLDGITDCALRTRAYRKQIPFHLNGHRIIFTLADLREIAEGQAFRPQVAAHDLPDEDDPGGEAPERENKAVDGEWRARRPRHG